MLFSPFKRCTHPKTGSIAWFSVCTICGASQHNGIFPSLPSPPLRRRFFMLCVRFFVFSLALHVFATTWPLLTVGRRRYDGLYGKHHVFSFFRACPMPPDAIDPTAAQLTTSLPTPLYTAFIFSCFWVFFPALCTCIIKLTFCIGGQRS